MALDRSKQNWPDGVAVEIEHAHDQGFFMTAALAPLDPEYHYCPLCREYIRETFHGSGIELRKEVR